MPDQLAAAAAAVDRAAELVEAATDSLARLAADDGRISVAKLDGHQVLAVRPRARGERRRRQPGDARLRRAGRAGVDARPRVRGRRGVRPRRQGARPRGDVGRRHRRPVARAAVRRDAPVAGVPVHARRHPPRARHRAPAPPRRLRARRRDVPPLRGGPHPSARRARAPHQRGRARGGRSAGSPSWAGSGSRCPRSTTAWRRAARPTTSAWSSPPRSCRGARSGSVGRSSPGPRSSPGRWSRAGPTSSERAGCRASRRVSSRSA